ncbi:MAG: 5-(carboxyamino)imidazole ribonucleotide mutase [candidate division WOR-3 bacterium]
MGKLVIIMGSGRDLNYARGIEKIVKKFGVNCELRVASAHKTPEKVLKIVRENEKEEVVFITIAGKSNALSGFVDANTTKPVIAAPPYSEKFCGVDIFSSLRMPKGVAPLVILGEEQAALSAIKILALSDEKLRERIYNYQKRYKEEIEKEDKKLNG